MQVHVQLDIAPTAEAITVVADALQENTATATGGSTLGRRQIENFPFNGRNFIQPRTRLPNVVQTASCYQVQGIQPARDGFSVNALRAQ